MPEVLAAILGWLIPAVVVFGVTALAIAILVWAVRRARRSPRARASAIAVRDRAGASLVRLDDAVDELEIEVGLSGALYGGGAPPSLRRARLSAQHTRDECFDAFRAASTDDAPPDEIRRAAGLIERRADEALDAIAQARAEHAAWVKAHVTAAEQVAATRQRLDALLASMGEPEALVADLSSRFDEAEWAPAAEAARSATTEAAVAHRLLEQAARDAQDPTTSVIEALASAERSLRQAESDARSLEETHRLVTQAALALPSEFEAARTAVRSALSTRVALEPGDAARLGDELRAIDAALTALEADAARRPTRTVDAIARLRDRLDLALGDAWTAQQRLRGARTALPGTLAAARAVLVDAESAVARGRGGADARARLLSAQSELAGARQTVDPVLALDAARRAMRHAEDAKALAAHEARARG